MLNWRRRDQSWTARQTGPRKNWPNWRTGGLCQIINPNSCDITQCRTAVVSEFMGSGYDGRFVARCGVRATRSRAQGLNSPASPWAARTANQPLTPPRTVSQPPTKYPSSGLAFHNKQSITYPRRQTAIPAMILKHHPDSLTTLHFSQMILPPSSCLPSPSYR